MKRKNVRVDELHAVCVCACVVKEEGETNQNSWLRRNWLPNQRLTNPLLR